MPDRPHAFEHLQQNPTNPADGMSPERGAVGPHFAAADPEARRAAPVSLTDNEKTR